MWVSARAGALREDPQICDANNRGFAQSGSNPGHSVVGVRWLERRVDFEAIGADVFELLLEVLQCLLRFVHRKVEERFGHGEQDSAVQLFDTPGGYVLEEVQPMMLNKMRAEVLGPALTKWLIR